MTDEQKDMERRLQAHPFLQGMTPHHIEILSKSAAPIQFDAGHVIFRAGEPASGFFLIEHGAVVIETRKDNQPPVVIDTVSAGEPLGWSWLFPPYRWEFDARAIEPTTTLCFSGILLRQHRDEDLTLSHELFKRMSQVMVRRLQAARRKLADGKTG